MSTIAAVLAAAKEHKRKAGYPATQIALPGCMFDALEAECEGILYRGGTLGNGLMIGSLLVSRGFSQ